VGEDEEVDKRDEAEAIDTVAINVNELDAIVDISEPAGCGFEGQVEEV